MKERKRRQSLGGAVLIMVLTVMFILMILLMAALTTVSTANQRIFTKFEENQAYYTARSALDVFTQNMMADKKYVAYKYTPSTGAQGAKREYKYGDGTKKADMKQGLGLQLDLYSITAQSGMNIKQSDLYAYANGISTPADKKDEYKEYFGIMPGSGSASGAEIKAIYYEVELPKTADSSSAYGKLSDKVNDVSKAKIKIEVLDRKYDMGDYNFTSGSHTGTDVKAYLNSLSDEDLTNFFSTDSSVPANKKMTATEAKDVAAAIFNGNRKKDTMRVKITATTEYDGVEGTAVLIIDSNEPPANNSSKAITAFGGTGSDNMSVVGGMAAENSINWGSNDGFIYGSVYVEDDFTMASNGPEVHLSNGESFYVGGDVSFSNDHFKVINDAKNQSGAILIDDESAPFVFIGGKLTTKGGLQTGSAIFKDIDVVTHGLEFSDTIGTGTGGKIYCVGDFEFNTSSNAKIDNDIYVTGDVKIRGNNDFMIQNDADGNPVLQGFGGSGHIYYGGSLTTNTGAPLITSGMAMTNITPMNPTEKAKILALPAKAVIHKNSADDNDKVIELSLPGRSQEKQLRTHSDNYNNYYVKDANGAVIIPVQKITAQTMADISTMTDKTKPLTAANTGITTSADTLITNNNHMVSGENFSYSLNTGGADVSCVLDSGSSKRNGIHISGGGTVNLVVSGKYQNETKILVDDDTTLKIIADTTTNKLDFAKLWVYNETTLKAFKDSSTPLNVGDKRGCGIKVPKIYYYVSGTNDFYIQNEGLLTGYVYAPDALLKFDASNAGSTDVNYNGNAIGSKSLAIIGSALCKGVDLKNVPGVAYINPDLDDDTPGEPIHNWQSFQYIRG